MKLNLNLFSNKKAVAINKVAVFLFIIVSIFSFISCDSKEENRIVIWTCSRDFAQYAELYNQSHQTNKIIIVYKENPAKSLPPQKDETSPDIIVGPWLQSESIYKNFKPLDYIFDRRILTSTIFYPQLLESGKINDSQFLLPVSYNLPAVIFSQNDKDKVLNDFTLSLEDLREAGKSYNETKKSGLFSKIGFPVTSNSDFLYHATKVYGVDFRNDGEKTKWNEAKLTDAVKNIYEWVSTDNKSFQTENDFAFKYLNISDYRQADSDRTLFSYVRSNRIFDILHTQDVNIDYRWIANDNKILIEDDAVFLGIYKKTKNQAGCTEFVTWLFNESNQDKLLERKSNLNLDTEQFGFAGGFSSLIGVTERILPKYYTNLLSNIPHSQMIVSPSNFNPRWEEYKKAVVEPFFMEALKAYERNEIEKQQLAESDKAAGTEAVLKSNVTIEDFEKEWRKKLFE